MWFVVSIINSLEKIEVDFTHKMSSQLQSGFIQVQAVAHLLSPYRCCFAMIIVQSRFQQNKNFTENLNLICMHPTCWINLFQVDIDGQLIISCTGHFSTVGVADYPFERISKEFQLWMGWFLRRSLRSWVPKIPQLLWMKIFCEDFIKAVARSTSQ